ncbi:MAG: VWA domain-containing protein, partial [Thermoguttaceae bacterium]|nr:VWA domain-containing protein [Thermoguttaceae bacterium]
MAPPKSPTLVFCRRAAALCGLLAFTIALADPQFGREEKSTPTFGRDIFVALDVSDSMLAEDVAPNRLTLAKLDVEDLVNAAVGDRIGLIAFAGSAQVEIPLTADRVFFRELLRNVDTTSVTVGGTALGDATRLALSRFGNAPGRARAIVLITDGEDWNSAPLEAARNAAEAGVPIYTVALGNLAGAKIPQYDAAGRRIGFKQFDG